jgi:hypothetical protein
MPTNNDSTLPDHPDLVTGADSDALLDTLIGAADPAGTANGPMHIAYVSADDWTGVYVNGKVYRQDHQIHPVDWMELLELAGCTVDRSLSDADAAYAAAEELGCFPVTFDDFANYTP